MAEKVEKKEQQKFFLYKGKPLVRSGGTLYYGDMADPYVAMIQILEEKEFQDMTLPQKVSVQIMSTNATLRPKERIKKRTEKSTLYDAINIASIWLERILDTEQPS